MLSATDADSITVRGYDLAELIGTVPFPSVVHLLYTGKLPDPPAARLIDAVMVASIDHGAGPPSVLAARTAISGGATLPAAAAAGLLTFGDYHGAAVEPAMEAIAVVLDRAGDGSDAGALGRAADELVADVGPMDAGSPGSATASTSIAILGSTDCSRSPRRSASPASTSLPPWRSRPA